MNQTLQIPQSIPFYKFDGAGNDFVLMDFREQEFQLTTSQVARLCHRRFGIGADGLMSLHKAPNGYDFEMRYYNSDGRLASMCGNGGRCIAVFAYLLSLGSHGRGDGLCQMDFIGPDGPHHADVLLWDAATGVGLVRLGMRTVSCADIRRCLDGWFLDTGSPHYVQRVSDLENFDVVGQGRAIRNRTDLFPEGTNVDFIEDRPDGSLFVRTFERGVEDETWACGTGVTACALVSGNNRVHTRGGDFRVTFNATGNSYENVCLTGPVAYNFCGRTALPSIG
ncbi:MAG: diaminopimelate epimerase [Bacteroidales bacterium]|nr:diaminopimelate epimerase [Bacteroidales bacterium]